MPTNLSLYAALVWFVVGFVTGLGWAIGSWLAGRLLR